VPETLYVSPAERPDWDLAWLENDSVPQSIQFMVDILPAIRRVTRDWRWSHPLEVLDLGAGSGAGSNVLATLYRGLFYRFPMRVTALDIVDYWKRYAEAKFPLLEYCVGDIYDWQRERSWDLVISSHVVEHVANPTRLVRELQRRARHWVLVYAPYNERPLISEHTNTIDDDLIDLWGPTQVRIVQSPAWYKEDDDHASCVLLELPGIAPLGTSGEDGETVEGAKFIGR
jgi:SAM-dependent methyltransferase